MRIAINKWMLVLDQAEGAKPLGEDGWNESKALFSIKHNDERSPIIGVLHFPSDIVTIIKVLERYNTSDGVYQALVNEMVTEGMVYKNPERSERCLDEPAPCSEEVCADICPPERCEAMRGGDS